MNTSNQYTGASPYRLEYRGVVKQMQHDFLTIAMNESWQYLRNLVEGLTDSEFFWEPVPNCWRIYQQSDGHWTYDYEIPSPIPAPLTTIGWRLVHLASCKVMYHEYAFGAQRMTFPELIIPHTAQDAIRWLEEGHKLLEADLATHTDDNLNQLVLTNWGEQWPAWRIFWTMLSHDLQHGAEIGCLRDLHRIWPNAVSIDDDKSRI